jgi:putative PIN family toxin of toxin-antitoxin system
VPLKVVFDTNILVSALGWRGPPFRCVELAHTGVVESVTCAGVLDEFKEKLVLKFRFSEEDAERRLAYHLRFFRVVRIPGELRGATRDPDDDKLLECAVCGKADYVVSGDKDLLVLGEYRGVKIVRASEFLAIVEEAQREG